MNLPISIPPGLHNARQSCSTMSDFYRYSLSVGQDTGLTLVGNSGADWRSGFINHRYFHPRPQPMATPYARGVEVCPQLNSLRSDPIRFYDVAIGFYRGRARADESKISELLLRLGAQTVGKHRLNDDVSFGFQRVYPKIVS